jgi:phosphate uptake regulator
MNEKDLGYRRVQSTGRGSYIISLPKDWAQNIGLRRGSEIAFTVQSDFSLVLTPRALKEKSMQVEKPELKEYCLTVDIKDDPQSVQRMIKALYAIGADIMQIRFKNAETSVKYKPEIKNFARDLFLGSEVIEEASNEITFQILIRHPEFPIERAVRRMSILALTADRDAISYFENGNQDAYQNVLNAYNDINRLSLYVVRQLKYGIERNLYKELGFETPKEFLLYRILVNDIKNITENALNLTRALTDFHKLVKDKTLFIREQVDEETYLQVLNFNALAHQLFEDSMKAMFKKDYKDAERVIAKRQSYTSLENELVRLMYSKKLDPHIATILRLFLDNSRRIMDHSQDIAELTLNWTVEEVCTKLAFA